MEFALPKSSNNPIKVIGVGGAGCNAVNNMISITKKFCAKLFKDYIL